MITNVLPPFLWFTVYCSYTATVQYTVLCGGVVQVVHPKSDEQRRRLNDAIKHILLFRSLEEVLYASLSLSVSLCMSSDCLFVRLINLHLHYFALHICLSVCLSVLSLRRVSMLFRGGPRLCLKILPKKLSYENNKFCPGSDVVSMFLPKGSQKVQKRSSVAEAPLMLLFSCICG